MNQDPTEFLAIHVLNEQQCISYRSLSRALKVHSNLAKHILHEFHRKQNIKKPGTVHATYLITGTRKTVQQTNGVNGNTQEDGDTVMRSSPPLPSSSIPGPEEEGEEKTVVRSVMIAKEEHLEEAKTLFETVSGVHIYSLEAKGLSDVQSLSDCNRRIAAGYASEDPLKEWKQYGTIQNPNARRRTTKRQPPLAPVNETLTKSKPAALGIQTSKESSASSNKPTPEPEKANGAAKSTTTKPLGPKREGSSIFSAFGKTKEKPKPQNTDIQAEGIPKVEPEDEVMDGLSADDADDIEPENDEEVTAPAGKSKKDRQAELEAMMDAEDEKMDDVDSGAIDSAEAATEEQSAALNNSQQSAEEPKEHLEVSNGRRRGKRRIMKKKTVRDEEGYLVTREEPAWESFSEDEPAPKKIKVPSMAQQSANKGGKKAAKVGQGNIMSFFGKK